MGQKSDFFHVEHPLYSKNRGLQKRHKKITKKITKKFLHEIPCKIYIFYNKNIPCKKHKKVTKKSQKKSQKKYKSYKKVFTRKPVLKYIFLQ